MTELEHLTPALRAAVLELAARIEAVDGINPLNESAAMVVEGTRPGHFHLESHAGAIVGFAVADERDRAIVLGIDPDHRNRDLGEELLAVALEDHPDFHVWAFGTLPGTEGLASRVGLVVDRVLLEMTRELGDEPEPQLPDGYTVEPYADEDIDDILAVNAAAFAAHPEQGQLTREEFDALTEEEWFDEDGLLVALDADDQVVGFHWTKSETPGLGEVYVIAVAPDHEGQGLGRALLEAGLRHLEQSGCTRVHLFVEASAPRTVEMYRSARFAVSRTDTSYRLENG